MSKRRKKNSKPVPIVASAVDPHSLARYLASHNEHAEHQRRVINMFGHDAQDVATLLPDVGYDKLRLSHEFVLQPGGRRLEREEKLERYRIMVQSALDMRVLKMLSKEREIAAYTAMMNGLMPDKEVHPKKGTVLLAWENGVTLKYRTAKGYERLFLAKLFAYARWTKLYLKHLNSSEARLELESLYRVVATK